MLPRLPMELVNKCFTYLSSNTAPLIREYWKRKKILDRFDIKGYSYDYINQLIEWDVYTTVTNNIILF
jgi:hypothetical protein